MGPAELNKYFSDGRYGPAAHRSAEIFGGDI